MRAPPTDPTPIFDLFRGNYATELLVAAAAHFRVFVRLDSAPRTFEELRADLRLASRPASVLVTALRAFGLVRTDADRRLLLTDLARNHLLPGEPFDVSDYLGPAASSPGVLAMIERLERNRPAGTDPDERGAAFIYREGIESAMEREATARSLTLALAGRARNVAPILAERAPLEKARLLVDVGGGTGIYSIAYLHQHPNLRAIVWDRPEVLRVAREMADQYGVSERLECVPGDMFADDLPSGVDAILLSNVLHDWDVPECRALVGRCAAALPANGELLIHDVFLNDTMDGPLAVALYSAALFFLTEGRAYCEAEFRQWLNEAGMEAGVRIPTLVHCGVLRARNLRAAGLSEPDASQTAVGSAPP